MLIQTRPCPPFPECLSPGGTPGVYMARLTAKSKIIAADDREADR